LIGNPIQPAIGYVAGRLGWKWVSLIAISGLDRKIVALRGHAFDYVSTPRVLRIVGLISLKETVSLLLTIEQYFIAVWQAASQDNKHQQQNNSPHSDDCDNADK
jgi:hypothetical protein